ncbi:ribose 5-phosphate isomerase A-domain-containing protein [Amylocystis lapponica]|nr:ribose 5-phosphate isomerase A-domain-containing protein [Amylocystis lapponica]
MPIPAALFNPETPTDSAGRDYPLPLRHTIAGTSPSSAAPDLQVPPPLTVVEASKRLAAWTAVDRHVLPEHKVIGIGSGSTVPYVVERIVAQGAAVNRERVFIPTGFQSKELIVNAHLRLGDVDQYPVLDVTIDGADEVDYDLNAIKGGGACHLREKVLAEAADTFVIVADYRKNSDVLGKNFTQGVPVEVAPFAYAKVLHNLHLLGSPKATLRMAKAKAGPVVSDNGNFVIDAPFPPETMKQPYELLTKIKMLTGVVEVGIFCHMAKAAYFGNQDGSVTIKWHDGKIEQVASGIRHGFIYQGFCFSAAPLKLNQPDFVSNIDGFLLALPGVVVRFSQLSEWTEGMFFRNVASRAHRSLSRSFSFSSRAKLSPSDLTPVERAHASIAIAISPFSGHYGEKSTVMYDDSHVAYSSQPDSLVRHCSTKRLPRCSHRIRLPIRPLGPGSMRYMAFVSL